MGAQLLAHITLFAVFSKISLNKTQLAISVASSTEMDSYW